MEPDVDLTEYGQAVDRHRRPVRRLRPPVVHRASPALSVAVETQFVEGEVWVNGVLTGSRLSPYITESGFWLWNRAGGWGGPHFEVRLLPADLVSLVAKAPGEIVHFELAGDDLGHVDECSGYAAADIGSHRRPLRRVIGRIYRYQMGTRFDFEGETGPLDLTSFSVHSPDGMSVARQAPWSFHLWFRIDDARLPDHFHEKQALLVMQEYVKRASNA
jgi:hypothetical protein